MSDAPFPAGTYRLQLNGTDEGDFGFAEAARLAPYLSDLGVSHVYLSPILRAAPGSTHGYDVIDHDHIAPELGGMDGFRAMADVFARHGLRVLVDLVPNHMAVPSPVALNRPLDSVVADGPRSEYASWFDVDWERGGGKIVLPGEGEPNYRRFFDISGLIALRQEDRDVFERTHRLVLDLVAEGLVHGLRIDHPDGLTDPRGYLEWLSDASGGAWTLVEKITTGEEQVPADWRCAGTTGYDALGMAGGLFVDPAGEGPLTEAYAAFTGGPADFGPVEDAARRDAASGSLRPEVERLLRSLTPEPERRAAWAPVLLELLVAVRVYRAYVVPGEEAPPQAAAVLAQAADRARAALPADRHDALAGLVRLALGLDAAPPEFVVRFQQTTAPLAAKGVEDTAFYRWNRLAALNEVGGDPERFGVEPDDFHAYCVRSAAERPATMTTLSTHDTKRQEDARARLAVLAELPGAWADAAARWQAWFGPGDSPLEPDLAYLFWQTLVAAWPLTGDRLTGFLTKAMREAKTRTNWIEPDAGYEEAVLRHAHRVLADDGLTADVGAFVAALDPHARAVTLGQKLVQLTMPGVPDVYQGCELVGRSLVDPDNRRRVDYDLRRTRLAALDGGAPPGDLDDEKLLVTSRALRLRREHPEWYGAEGGYTPVGATGPAAGHAVAFARGPAITVATRLPAGLAGSGGWRDTALVLPPGRRRDVLTGRVVESAELSALLAELPVALLVPAEEGA